MTEWSPNGIFEEKLGCGFQLTKLGPNTENNNELAALSLYHLVGFTDTDSSAFFTNALTVQCTLHNRT
jgi:hypothetical protein